MASGDRSTAAAPITLPAAAAGTDAFMDVPF